MPCGLLLLLASLPLQEPSPHSQLALEFEALSSEEPLLGHTPQLSRSADGSVHLIWMTATGEKGETRIQHRRWSGGSFSEATVLEQGKGWFVNWADFPQYQQDADGGAVLSWLAHAAGGRGYGAMFRKRREGGAAWSSPQVLHEDREAVEHGFVSLVALGEGRFFANWLQSGKDGPPTALRGAVLTPEGMAAGERVLDALVCDCCGTDSVVLPSGKVIVAYRDRTEEEFRDIQVVRGDPTDPESWEVPVAIGSERWRTQACPVNGPALDADQGAVALAYFTGGFRSGTSVRLAMSSNGGKRWDPPRILKGGEGVLGRVDVAILPDEGPIVVTWLEQTEEGSVWCARAADRRGGAMGPILRFAEVEAGRNAGFLRLMATKEGVVAAWNDRQDGQVRLGILKIPAKESVPSPGD